MLFVFLFFMVREKILVTSALPYVNNVPHLGNLVGCVLSADVFARFKRSLGSEVLFICGSDEHGTATENKAREENVSPRDLCDKYHEIHKNVYDWFSISFDHYGRTSLGNHHSITRDLFLKALENGFVEEQVVVQPFCESCNSFLADRFVKGSCPHCGYDSADGDQCESCGKLLNPDELLNPKCKVDGSVPVFKKTDHLFLSLDKLQPRLEEWVASRSVEGFWSENTVRTTRAWFAQGLKSRAITRDLLWGISVPDSVFGGKYKGKVFYVWFDAPIGYISITAQFSDSWRDWWFNSDVKLFQFMGKDNIPFHSIIFPASLLASGDDFNLVYHINATEYLNYEGGPFSKSKGRGVFGDNAKNSGIPSDVFRYYLIYNRPEGADTQFSWKNFQERVNNELLANFGNLINRTLTFIHKFFGGNLGLDESLVLRPGLVSFLDEHKKDLLAFNDLMNQVKLKDALKLVLKISAKGNVLFQESAPWKKRIDDEAECKQDLFVLLIVIKDLAILIEPFMPLTSKAIFEQLNLKPLSLSDAGKLGLHNHSLNAPAPLFKRIEDKEVDELISKYSSDEDFSFGDLDVVVGQIVKVEKHPDAEKLYIEQVDIGSEIIQIVSGLVPYYSEEELLNKKILVVKNLETAMLRKVKSSGMLLAASDDSCVEVLSSLAPVGTKVLGSSKSNPKKSVSVKDFFKIKFSVKDCVVFAGKEKLFVDGKEIRTLKVKNGLVK